MKGDFSRLTFDPRKHFTRVLLQQGRVQLDADWNEQAAILLHYLQTLAADLIGDHGGTDGAFEIVADASLTKDFRILRGHYYVNGILCKNDEEQLPYTGQAGYPFLDANELDINKTYLVYLDVWERLITYIEDDSIREVALSGPDTATRAQVVWQVKTTNQMPDGSDITGTISKNDVENHWDEWLEKWQPANRGQLKAKAKEDSDKDINPCITPPESRYRGAENQLYRVEIHKGGKAWDGSEGGKANAATFKCSRDNGSVVAAWIGKEGNDLVVGGIRDNVRGFAAGQWVELIHEDLELRGEPGTLVKLSKVEGEILTIDPATASGPVDLNPKFKNPKVRRWDHKAGDPRMGGLELNQGAALIKEGEGDEGWLTLEDGVQIQFQKPKEGSENQYRTGNYWLVPARTATGDVEWPGPVGQPEAVAPHGVQHYYAPLAIISFDGNGKVTTAPTDLRRKIEQVGQD